MASAVVPVPLSFWIVPVAVLAIVPSPVTAAP